MGNDLRILGEFLLKNIKRAINRAVHMFSLEFLGIPNIQNERFLGESSLDEIISSNSLVGAQLESTSLVGFNASFKHAVHVIEPDSRQPNNRLLLLAWLANDNDINFSVDQRADPACEIHHEVDIVGPLDVPCQEIVRHSCIDYGHA